MSYCGNSGCSSHFCGFCGIQLWSHLVLYQMLYVSTLVQRCFSLLSKAFTPFVDFRFWFFFFFFFSGTRAVAKCNFPCNYPVQTFTFCDAEDSCNLTWIKRCILLVYKGHQKKHVMQFLTNKKKQLRRLYYKSVHCIVWGLNPEEHRRELPGSPSRGWVAAVPRTTACWRWRAVFVLLKGSGWFFGSVIDAVLKTASE